MEKQTELVVISPWFLQHTPRSKKYAMNLNTFLGLDRTMGNLLKKRYARIIQPQLHGVKLKTPIEVTVQIYNPSKRKSDKSNMFSISSKFLYDAMVLFGVIPDDCDDFIKTETILPSIYDKNNGRVTFTFNSIKSGDEVNNGRLNDDPIKISNENAPEK